MAKAKKSGYTISLTVTNRETGLSETVSETVGADRDDGRGVLADWGRCFESYDCFLDIEPDDDEGEV